MNTATKIKHLVIGFSSTIILLNVPIGIYFGLKGVVKSNDWMATAGIFQILMGTYMYLYLSSFYRDDNS